MRLEKLFLKMFQVEPRVPVRLMLDISAVHDDGRASRTIIKIRFRAKAGGGSQLYRSGPAGYDYAAALFATKLLDPFVCGGGRHRFQPAEEFLRS